MSTAKQDVASFTNFAMAKIGAGGSQLTIDELFDQWRVENPSDEQYAENVAAIRASIEDFKAGERGTIAGEHSAELRQTFRSPSK
jgi:hypothetical protein